MNWFKNLKTGAKLLLGFGTMLVLLGMVIFIAYTTIMSIRNSQQHLMDQAFVGVINMVELRANLNRQRSQMLQMILIPDRAKQEFLVQDIRSRIKVVEDSLEQLGSVYKNNTEFMTKLDELKTTLAAFRQTREVVFLEIFAGQNKEALSKIQGIQAERYEKMNTISIALGKEMLGYARAQVAASNELTTKSMRTFTILGGLALLIGVVLTIVLNQLISRPLIEITRSAERMASGDLRTQLLTEQRTDEVGALKHVFARMSENLRAQILGLVEGANVLGSAASEIVASTTQLSASASESAVAVSETTTTVEEVRQTAQMSSQKAKLVSESAQKVAQSSQSGYKSIEDVNKGMENIRQQMNAIAASMVRLSEQNQAIGQIIASVEDLATQSNLLAVNASIEAAKAGEHGKGFSVVAQEVKSLAEQSRQATNQVRTLLGDIQKATTTAVMATEQGSKAVEVGAHQTELAGEAIQALTDSVIDSAQAATQIAASSQEQLVGVDQVAVAMDSIKLASSQNVASAQQLETAARNLSDLGQRLKQMVERYQV